MMRNEFHEHPDGFIGVRSVSGIEYVDTRANFEKDYGDRIPAIDIEFDDHVYTPGVRHCYMLDGNVIAGGPDPWEFGDKVIAAVSKIRELKDRRAEDVLKAKEDETKRFNEEMERRRKIYNEQLAQRLAEENARRQEETKRRFEDMMKQAPRKKP